MRILVVENDAAAEARIVNALEREGVSVDCARDGERVLERVMVIDYAAVILNWELPKVDGLSVLQELRRAGSQVRVLMTGQCKRTTNRIRALRVGADDFLTKPIATEELVVRVQALLRRPSRMLSTLRIDTLELDRLKRKVSRDGTPINLSQNEFALLELMMRNAETAIPREIMMQGAWGFRDAELAEMVDVYVDRLRAKIDGGGARPLIEFVLGIGYRISSSIRQRSLQ